MSIGAMGAIAVVPDGRALTQRGIERIEEAVYKGRYDDQDLRRIFETIRVQRKVLRELFNLFQYDPSKRESNADPIRNSTLAHFKELVSMEDPRASWE